MRKITIAMIIMILVSLMVGFTPKHENFGVFLNLDRDKKAVLEGYKTIVIEPENFTKEDILEFHKSGKMVYAYLNIGALEKFRTYYTAYEKYSLGVYENWPDEKWMDVSKKKWQMFIVNSLGKKYAKLGVDGFFIDNTDVYYEYPKNKIYRGLVRILANLKKKYGVEILINGGDEFVKKALKRGEAGILDGINQECVFTKIDFQNRKYLRQENETIEYFQKYLSKIKKSGKKVYLIEYAPDKNTREEILEYCNENEFKCFIAADLELGG